MLRKLILCFFLCTCIFSTSVGQGIPSSLSEVISSSRYTLYKGVYRDPIPNFFFWLYTKTEDIEKSRLQVIYDVKIKVDTAVTSVRFASDRVRSLIGINNILCHGLSFWDKSINQTKLYVSEEDAAKLNGYEMPSGYNTIINWFVLRNIGTRQIRNLHALPLRKNYAIGYEEAQPQFKWTILRDTVHILNYECQKAETDYAGRHWCVWFTMEIPVDCGLWKFSGLPGLILRAADDEGFYSYDAVSVENSDAEIQIPLSVKVKHLDIKGFKKEERSIYRAPVAGSNCFPGGCMIGSHPLTSEGPAPDQDNIYTPENYLNLYFPMEIE